MPLHVDSAREGAPHPSTHHLQSQIPNGFYGLFLILYESGGHTYNHTYTWNPTNLSHQQICGQVDQTSASAGTGSFSPSARLTRPPHRLNPWKDGFIGPQSDDSTPKDQIRQWTASAMSQPSSPSQKNLGINSQAQWHQGRPGSWPVRPMSNHSNIVDITYRLIGIWGVLLAGFKRILNGS